MKRKSKSPIRKIQDKIWQECRRIQFEKYGNTCWTCGKGNLEGANRHLGHMWAKASLSAYLKYDLRVLRPQCFHCNINLGGMGADFYTKSLQELGKAKMNKLEKDRQVTVKAIDHYTTLLTEYTSL